MYGFGQLVELDVLLVVLELGFIGEGKLLLAFLPVEGLLFESGDLLLVVLFLLVELVDGDFGKARIGGWLPTGQAAPVSDGLAALGGCARWFAAGVRVRRRLPAK